MIVLGNKVKDTITGFEGVVVAKTTWVNGCVRFAVQSMKLHDGKPVDEVWFDDGRLRLASIGVHGKIAVRDTGGPQRDPSAPIGR